MWYTRAISSSALAGQYGFVAQLHGAHGESLPARRRLPARVKPGHQRAVASQPVNLTRNGGILGTHTVKAKLTSSRGMDIRGDQHSDHNDACHFQRRDP